MAASSCSRVSFITVFPTSLMSARGLAASQSAASFCRKSDKEKSDFGSGTPSETQAGVWPARISSGRQLVVGRPSLCTRTKRGEKALLSCLCDRVAKLPFRAISTPRFPFVMVFGWPAFNFASYRSAIMMGHSVWSLSAGDRPADAGSMYPPLVTA